MKASFIIAALFVTFTSSSALAAHVQTSNTAAIHCSKDKRDSAYLKDASQAAPANAAGKAQVAK